VYKIFRPWTGIAAMALLGAAVGVGPARLAQAQTAPDQTQKKVKDKGEYDLLSGATKETDPAKKLALLNAWKEKYPESDYKIDRLVMTIQAYSALQQWPNVVDAAKEALAVDARNINALYWITSLTPNLKSVEADVLATCETAANGLLAAQRPATAKEADWPNVKRGFDILAHRTLGWIAMQRKANGTAEQEFMMSLQLDANQAQVSYWLGSVVLAQRKAARFSDAIYYFARAVACDGLGALAPQARSTADSYLAKLYAGYHGDNSGLDELKATARANVFVPDGFHIMSATEIAAQKAGLGPVYVNSQDPSERLQLNGLDSSFALREGGQRFTGSYSVSSNMLRLHIVELDKDVEIAIDGKRLIVSGGEVWVQPN